MLPASHNVVTPLARQKWSVWPPMSEALTKIWAWMSTSPGVTSRPLALIVRRASAAGSEGATATDLAAGDADVHQAAQPAGRIEHVAASKQKVVFHRPLHPIWLLIVGHRRAAGNPDAAFAASKGARLMP